MFSTVGRSRELPDARRPYQEHACTHCGALHWIDERLAGTTCRSPKFGSCCDHGQVRLLPLPDPPQPLRQLFVGLTGQDREFRENIRQYNTALAFTSLGVQQDHGVNTGVGPYIFRIHGELCHLAGALLPEWGWAHLMLSYIYMIRVRHCSTVVTAMGMCVLIPCRSCRMLYQCHTTIMLTYTNMLLRSCKSKLLHLISRFDSAALPTRIDDDTTCQQLMRWRSSYQAMGLNQWTVVILSYDCEGLMARCNA